MARLTPEDFERQLHATLKSLPDRRAPVSLENRVLAAIAARDARPWWHKSYQYWPSAVRVAFLVLSATLAAVLIAAGANFIAGVEPAAAQPVAEALDWFAQLRALGDTVTGLVGRLLANVSSTWIYLGLGVFGLLYAALLGLGAPAYRLLWQAR
ncbi:MAG TPA: hypothetical protein VGD81_11985 [Opitutaceae bacterium]